MADVNREIDLILTLLRNKIRERGFTQLEVQAALGWGRSYISQLFTKAKTLRVDQILLMLNVIGVHPAEFYGELYRRPRETAAWEPTDAGAATDRESIDDLRHSSQELGAVMRGLLALLIDKGIITPSELSEAVRKRSLRPLPGPHGSSELGAARDL